MKRTKNMVYRKTVESRELFLCTINNGTTYKKAIIPTLENLKKHCKRAIMTRKKLLTHGIEWLLLNPTNIKRILAIRSASAIDLLLR